MFKWTELLHPVFKQTICTMCKGNLHIFLLKVSKKTNQHPRFWDAETDCIHVEHAGPVAREPAVIYHQQF